MRVDSGYVDPQKTNTKDRRKPKEVCKIVCHPQASSDILSLNL